MEDIKSAPAKEYTMRLLRNYFSKSGAKSSKGDVISTADQEEANRLLASGIAEKLDARSFD